MTSRCSNGREAIALRTQATVRSRSSALVGGGKGIGQFVLDRKSSRTRLTQMVAHHIGGDGEDPGLERPVGVVAARGRVDLHENLLEQVVSGGVVDPAAGDEAVDR